MKKAIGLISILLVLSALLFAGGNSESSQPAVKSSSGETELVYLNSHADPWDGPVGQEIFDKFDAENSIIYSINYVIIGTTNLAM